MNGRYADLTVWSLNIHVIQQGDSKPAEDDTMAWVFFRRKGLSFRILNILQESYRPFIRRSFTLVYLTLNDLCMLHRVEW